MTGEESYKVDGVAPDSGGDGTYQLSGGYLYVNGQVLDGSGFGRLNVDGGSLSATRDITVEPVPQEEEESL